MKVSVCAKILPVDLFSTDLVKLGTARHWDGFNCGHIDSVENKSTGKIYDLSKW